MKKFLKWLLIIIVVLVAAYYGWRAWAMKEYGQHLPSTTLNVNGVDREYHYYVPENPPDGPLGLLMMLNGGSVGAWRFPQQGDYEALAEKEGFVLALPIGKTFGDNEGAWQLNTREGEMQDIEMTLAIIEDMGKHATIDPARIHAVGYSLGSMYSYEYACQMSDTFASIASFAGTMPVNPDSCDPPRNVPLMHIHGVKDPIIAYNNSWNWKAWDAVGEMKDIPSLVAFWQEKYNCRDVSEEEGDGLTHFVYSDCDQDSRVEHYRITEGDHEWPATLNGVPTYEVIWSFLDGFRNPQ